MPHQSLNLTLWKYSQILYAFCKHFQTDSINVPLIYARDRNSVIKLIWFVEQEKMPPASPFKIGGNKSERMRKQNSKSSHVTYFINRYTEEKWIFLFLHKRFQFPPPSTHTHTAVGVKYFIRSAKSFELNFEI